jgi:hypothetical protein
MTLEDLLVFHYVGEWMEEAGPYIRGGTGDGQYVEVENVDDFSRFALDSASQTVVHLPLLMKRWPPIPYIPRLNPISNPDGDGNYAVTWDSSASLADAYILEEDDNAAFSSPTTRYSGSDTRWEATDKGVGTYFYRVKARNVWGQSGWSETRAVTVLPPSDHFEGDSPPVSFDVTDDQQVCNFEMTVSFGDGTCHVHLPVCTHIVDGRFAYWALDPWHNSYENLITGRFQDQDHVEGSYSLHWCGSTLHPEPHEGDWTATKE